MITTPRLQLLPFTRDMMIALHTDRQAFKERTPSNVPDSWPGPDFEEALPFFIKNTEDRPDNTLSFIILHKESDILIGVMGFKEPPDEGNSVEVGYSIIPEYEGQGYATEAVRALCDWARQHLGVRPIRAETLPDNLASQRVLQKAGFLLFIQTPDLQIWKREA